MKVYGLNIQLRVYYVCSEFEVVSLICYTKLNATVYS